MRRWLIILLLIVYPFQVALALADDCCATTPAGVTHHAVAAQAGEPVAAAPTFLADDAPSALADPHCAACSFGHQLYLPSIPLAIAVKHQPAPRAARDIPLPAAPPAARLERPKWPAAAR